MPRATPILPNQYDNSNTAKQILRDIRKDLFWNCLSNAISMQLEAAWGIDYERVPTCLLLPSFYFIFFIQLSTSGIWHLASSYVLLL